MARLLVLGGSWFLGRAVVENALALGWDVTTFRRGLGGSETVRVGVTAIRGDRKNQADLERLAAAGPWDAVIDTSSFVPRETLAMANELADVVDRYVLISTVSVYEGWPIEPLDEASAVLECPSDADGDFGYDGDPGPSKYGFGKAGCEQAISEVFGPERSVLLRPGVILGPHEYVGRLPWWLRRVERGGRVLAPGRPSRRIQPVDVRDVAAFALNTALGTGPVGTFNITATRNETMSDLLTACQQAIGSNADFTWVTDDDWLVGQGVTQWTEIPLWRTYRGAWAVDSAKAHDAGLSTRPIIDTVTDTWAWLLGGERAIAHERSSEQGIDAEKESTILSKWDKQA